MGSAIAYPQRAAPIIQSPVLNSDEAIRITARQANRWQEQGFEVWHLRGDCRVAQDNMTATGSEAVVWIKRDAPRSGAGHQVLVYFEGKVRVDYSHRGEPHRTTGQTAQSISGRSWFGRLESSVPVNVQTATVGGRPAAAPEIYARGREASRVRPQATQPRQAQFTGPETIPAPTPSTTSAPRRVLVQPRTTVPLQARSFTDATRQEQITLIDRGVKITIDGLAEDRLGELGRIVILADRVVVWSSPLDELNVSQESIQRGETPLEFYLEGNIVFAQGDRVIYADRMYYDVQRRTGTILNAEVLTPVPDYQGLLRLKADVVQQLDEENFQAFGAAVTSSRLGVPSYWFQAGNVTFRDVQTPIANPFTGQVQIDPRTGEPAVDHELLATSRNNFIYLEGFPIFYWPAMATNLKKPVYYINRLSLRSDDIFGFQARTNWDVQQLLGISNPIFLDDWGLSVDYLEKRGLGVGTNGNYFGDNLLGIPGPYRGMFDAWGIKDDGLDNLGLDRRALVPPDEYRGRILGRHRQDLDLGFSFLGEFGYISDKNFLEQYYEREWDVEKDQITGVLLNWSTGVHSLNLASDIRINDFFTQTESLPRLDHFLLGGSPLNDWFTWYAHSYAGYHRLKTAGPTAAPDPSIPLAWETTTGGVPYSKREGLLAGTRQEIDLPINAGWFKVIPYALGDVMFMKEDRDGDDVTRAYGQLGVRASLPFWQANPTVQSELWNLNGLAHKVTLDGDFFWSDANRNAERFPLYNPLDDDSQEAFRRRFFIPTGTLAGLSPAFARRYDERSFAFRSGMQSLVTATSPEIADDLMVAQLGLRQRWQTKRGLPGRERIIDWIVFDVQGSFFPKADRDNFGADVGQLDYDFRWHVGDRVTLLSDGYFDTFGGGLRTASVGGIITRPEIGDVYVGFRSIEGPISSSVLTATVSYRMSPKWIATAGSSYDFGNTGNIGQTVAFTRIGESFLVRVGFNIDVSRGNAGIQFSIEPRFLPSNRLGMIGGVRIPPAGARGVE